MEYKIITIIGARPQIIKAAALSRVFREKYAGKIREVLVHTGQHYDENMSEVFFRQMNIPSPDYQLGVGSASHAVQTARMMEKMEEVFLKEKPKAVIVYGDTNSTLAGAVATSKIHIPLIHIEAGLRSFNKAMPEEINRIVADHLSTLLFTPTLTGLKNLIHEGFNNEAVPPFSADNPKIYLCGDIMLDNTLYFAQKAENNLNLLDELNIKGKKFILCTIHRDSNTDHTHRLLSILSGLVNLAEKENIQIVLPLHPRTRKTFENIKNESIITKFTNHPLIKILPPAGFMEMCLLEKHCSLIITDSGGVQKEAYFFQKPCVVLRSETEWVEPVEAGCTALSDANEAHIQKLSSAFLHSPPQQFPPIFGDGKAAYFIAEKIDAFLKQN